MKGLNFDEIPSSVYRLQLNAEFPLKKAIEVLPYLKELGIEGIYCSPYFKAYSSHGYDVTDPNTLNPQIGSLEEFEQFCDTLQQLGMKHVIDVVPNHMGIKGGENKWWQDVLENGPYSEYACFFDINWSPDKKELQDRVLLPILGAPYGKVLENQEIKLVFQEGLFFLHYADYPLPVAPHAYPLILETLFEELTRSHHVKDADLVEYQNVVEIYRFFPLASHERLEKKQEAQHKLQGLCAHSETIRKHLQQVVAQYNGKKRQKDSLDALDRLLEAQFYRLSYWRVASHEINYRRFFNIHELVSIRIEEDQVLEAHHRWLFQLLDQKQVQGIRIDHPDGLYDPKRYFERLRERFKVLTVVEKILDRKEKLPEIWQVNGTVGYEYLNLLNGVFIEQGHEKAFTEIYEEFIASRADFDEIVYTSKKLFTNYEMVSEVEALGSRLDHISETSREYRDFTRHDLTEALAEVIACFPVYRTYINPEGKVSSRDARYISIAIKKARSRAVDLDPSIFEFLEKMMLNKLRARSEEKECYKEFVLKFQQLTGPMMAKGLEDTTFYVYNRFISLNEVGGDPPHFGYSVNEFHKLNQEKKEKWPFGFLSSSTHDSKRSEDVRMRLNVLSEIPDIWRLEVKKWEMVNAKYKNSAPSSNTEYFIYQTLLGVWPKTPLKKEAYTAFLDRIWRVMLKSLREAKKETSWHAPNHEYEQGVRKFFYAILKQSKTNHFLKMFLDFHKKIDRFGSYNSLSHTALKIASPGIVDFYQGNELLTYRLVDPDNRQPIDFDYRKKIVASLNNKNAHDLFISNDLEKTKCAVTWKALQFRRENRELFLKGEYIPLSTRGAHKEQVIAFMRKYQSASLITIVGRFFSKLAIAEWDFPLAHHAWGDTEIVLPSDFLDKDLIDLFTEKRKKVKKRGKLAYIKISEVFDHLPVSYLYEC